MAGTDGDGEDEDGEDGEELSSPPTISHAPSIHTAILAKIANIKTLREAFFLFRLFVLIFVLNPRVL